LDGSRKPLSHLPWQMPRDYFIEWEEFVVGERELDLQTRSIDGVHQLIMEQAEAAPESKAVVFDGEFLTYRQLDRRSNQVAHRLISRGVGRGDLVAVQMERCLDLVTVLLGILKTGAAYVPIDVQWPASRRKLILNETRAQVLVTQSFLADHVDPELFPCLDIDLADTFEGLPETPPTAKVTADDLMYVLYTSGTTGEPKGVMVEHAGILNVLTWMVRQYRFSSADCVLHKAAYTFDASVCEIFLPLISGGTLVIAKPGGYRDPKYLAEVIRKECVTTIVMVPSMLWHFLDEPLISECRSLRHVFCGGERLSPELRDYFFSKLHIPLHNLYGPTEASILVTTWTCWSEDTRPFVPIGSPIDNVVTYVFDEEGCPVPVGAVGELYIGGVALARGYLGRLSENAKRFIPYPDPQSRWHVLYRTGDLVRQHPDGILEYKGRVDEQVKINGFRVELGEIEACLRRVRQVRNVAVVAEQTIDGRGAQLVAYLEATLEEISLRDLRDHLANYVPDYMIPTRFKVMRQFPLSAHEKLDKAKLADLPAVALTNESPGAAASTDMERWLVGIWSEILGVPSVGIRDDFFELGGDSIAALKIVAMCKQKGIVVTPEDMFKLRRIEAIATALHDRSSGYPIG
jgi:amino acid adenylation domain-containing protein